MVSTKVNSKNPKRVFPIQNKVYDWLNKTCNKITNDDFNTYEETGRNSLDKCGYREAYNTYLDDFENCR